jgi:class 3 adenylate cyclase
MQPDTPARAVRCATSIVDGMRSLDLQVRGGIHTGEIEIKGDDIAGIAVHIAARVAALAAGRQVLVSSTVRDLVAGSNLRFADQGVRALKGIPQKVRLFDTRLGGFRTDISEDQLRGAPTFYRDRDYDWSDRNRERELHDYWRTPYYWGL